MKTLTKSMKNHTFGGESLKKSAVCLFVPSNLFTKILFGALRYAGSFLFSFGEKRKKKRNQRKKKMRVLQNSAQLSCLSSIMNLWFIHYRGTIAKIRVEDFLCNLPRKRQH